LRDHQRGRLPMSSSRGISPLTRVIDFSSVWKEAQPEEGLVQPAYGDAVVLRVRRRVVHGVVVGGQDQVGPLEHPRVARRRVMCAHLWNWFRAHDVRQIEKVIAATKNQAVPSGQERGANGDGQRDEAVVPVGLHEVVARDLLLIDVVLAEGRISALPMIGHSGVPQCRHPVDEAGEEVRRHEPEHQRGERQNGLVPMRGAMSTRSQAMASA